MSIDGLLWKTMDTKRLWQPDGTLEYIILEKHRITGMTRVGQAVHPEIRAQDYTRGDSE